MNGRHVAPGIAALIAAAAMTLGPFASRALAASVTRNEPMPLPAQCGAPDEVALVDAGLPRLARRLKAGEPLTVVVVGSGSAAGSGTTRGDAAFPARLAARLEAAYPKSKPRVVVLAAMGQTSPAMRARIAREIVPLRPVLVVWQTGSADAARGVPVMDFGIAIERGIAELHEIGSDVLLMDGQFSPRASLLINTDGYRETVRWNARRFDVPLFKRYDTMQYWSSNDVFDLDATDKAAQLDNADRIHDCVGAWLFRLIRRGVGAEPKS